MMRVAQTLALVVVTAAVAGEAFQAPVRPAALAGAGPPALAARGEVHIDTPLVWSSALSSRLEGDVYLKMDAVQPGGSFKIRGIGRLCAKLVDDGAETLYSSSCANAGMAAAVAGRVFRAASDGLDDGPLGPAREGGASFGIVVGRRRWARP